MTSLHPPSFHRNGFSTCNSYVYDFSKANYNSMCDFLLDSDFRALFESMDIEFVWSVIKSFIFEAVFLFTRKIL